MTLPDPHEHLRVEQDGRDIGRAWKVRLHAGGAGPTRLGFDTDGDCCAALDPEIPCTLRDAAGNAWTLRVTKSFYSWGSFRVHGELVEA